MEASTAAVVVAALIGPFGAAWVGIRVGLNGVKQDVEEIKRDYRCIRTDVGEIKRKIAVLEDRAGRGG